MCGEGAGWATRSAITVLNSSLLACQVNENRIEVMLISARGIAASEVRWEGRRGRCARACRYGAGPVGYGRRSLMSVGPGLVIWSAVVRLLGARGTSGWMKKMSVNVPVTTSATCCDTSQRS